MTREEVFDQLTLKAEKLAKELNIKLLVINFRTSLRFDIDGEWIGWWDGQKDLFLYGEYPSQKRIDECIKEAEKWFDTLPKRMNDYKKWVNGDRLSFAKEVNRRYQKEWGKDEIHDFLEEVLEEEMNK